jgi:hypothetical protein
MRNPGGPESESPGTPPAYVAHAVHRYDVHRRVIMPAMRGGAISVDHAFASRPIQVPSTRGPARPLSHHPAANPRRRHQLSPAACWNVRAMILYPAWLACWFGPRGGAVHAHVHWQIKATLRGTVPIPGIVT